MKDQRQILNGNNMTSMQIARNTQYSRQIPTTSSQNMKSDVLLKSEPANQIIKCDIINRDESNRISSLLFEKQGNQSS